jgi:hypothetical protein
MALFDADREATAALIAKTSPVRARNIEPEYKDQFHKSSPPCDAWMSQRMALTGYGQPSGVACKVEGCVQLCRCGTVFPNIHSANHQ